MDDHGRTPSSNQPILYVLDTNVLIHDPNAMLNFEEHHVAIPMTVLEELDKLKTGKLLVAAECRQAIRLIDQVLGVASPENVEKGVPIQRGKSGPKGFLSILMNKRSEPNSLLPYERQILDRMLSRATSRLRIIRRVSKLRAKV